jgi:hypothetical protein
MAAVKPLVHPEILHPKVGSQIDDQGGSRIENSVRDFTGLAVLESQIDYVLPAGHFGRLGP